jgi:hypothetical protein
MYIYFYKTRVAWTISDLLKLFLKMKKSVCNNANTFLEVFYMFWLAGGSNKYALIIKRNGQVSIIKANPLKRAFYFDHLYAIKSVCSTCKRLLGGINIYLK